MPNCSRTAALLVLVGLLAGCSGPGGLSLATSPSGTTLDIWWDPDTGEAVAAEPGTEPAGMIPLLVVPEPQASPGVFSGVGVVPAEKPSPASPAPGVIYGHHRPRDVL